MKRIASTILAAATVWLTFTTVVYTGCKKDKCKGVTCDNGGTCKDGSCTCATGYSGGKCSDEVRSVYAKSYKGAGVDTDGEKYPESVFSFSASGSDVLTMTLDIAEMNGTPVNSFDVKLETNSTYTIVDKTSDGITYTGSGTISETTASCELKVQLAGRSYTVTYANLVAE